jgi:hypothetical protein
MTLMTRVLALHGLVYHTDLPLNQQGLIKAQYLEESVFLFFVLGNPSINKLCSTSARNRRCVMHTQHVTTSPTLTTCNARP